MDLGIKGKRALVLGGSSGLGLECCRAFAAEGVDLVIFARGQDRMAEARKAVTSAYDVAVDLVAGDVTVRSDVTNLVDYLRDSGGIDILVLNTPPPPRPMLDFLQETEDDRWENAYKGQLEGALYILRDVTPLMLDRGWGRIVGITSSSVKQPMARHALSTVFRAGVQAALKHLVDEVGPHGITVNAVAPASVVSDTYHLYHNVQGRIDAAPLKRVGKPEELAGTVVFLASQQAGFITGQSLQVDGGISKSFV
ncbi:SDR family oxidoreductase [Streptomyces sp. 5-6(2022)]|uniref:SDR family oxidoreductase n=1 Tax=Streptomyces sp. 5-6(2022) TaxID=2936510 RepID=UPI0023B97E2A|nr:SDR family oxidoreductase [Streptomyces sp. 5-6(2022)]